MDRKFLKCITKPILTIIHSQNLITIKIWHILLQHAHPNLLKNNSHRISLASLSIQLNIKNKNLIIKKLKNMPISKFNVVNKYIFNHIEINEKFVIYSYPSVLKLLLSHQYVLDVTKMLNKSNLKSKHSFFIYELCLYIDFFKYIKYMPITTFKNYMNANSTQHKNSKIFYNFQIKPIHEINEKSNLKISIVPVQQKKCIIGFKFNITNKFTTNLYSLEERCNFTFQNLIIFKYINILDENLTDFNEETINNYIAIKEKEDIRKSILENI